MITGRLTANLEPVVLLTLVAQDDPSLAIDAIVDTGFNGELTLRQEHLQALRAQWLCREEGELADGSTTVFDVYVAHVLWNDQERRIEVEMCNGPPLIGMSLIRGCELRMQVEADGFVSIRYPGN